MNTFYKFLIPITLLPFFSVAQSNYKPGYVINLKGDTLKGLIDYREWDSNPATINFKSTVADKKVSRFAPSDISFFKVDGIESYITYTGPVSMDATDPNHLAQGRDSSFKTETVFLKVLQNGNRVSLYSYTDDIKLRFYIKESSDAIPLELIYRTYYNHNENGNGASIDENTYLKQLLALAQKYNVLNDSFQGDLEHSSYNKTSILKLTSLINGINKADFQKQYSNNTALGFFATVGLNSTATKSQNEYLASGGKSYTSNLPAVSVGINIFANPNTGKLIFRVELSAAESKYESNYVNQISPYIPVTYSYNQLALALSPQIIYNFYNAENLKIYGGIGLAISSYRYSNVIFESQDGKTSGSQITTNNPSNFTGFGAPVMVKLGVQFTKNLGIFASYLTTSPVSHDPFFELTFTTTRVGLTYAF